MASVAMSLPKPTRPCGRPLARSQNWPRIERGPSSCFTSTRCGEIVDLPVDGPFKAVSAARLDRRGVVRRVGAGAVRAREPLGWVVATRAMLTFAGMNGWVRVTAMDHRPLM